jgi:LacI family transcriptional regulator
MWFKQEFGRRVFEGVETYAESHAGIHVDPVEARHGNERENELNELREFDGVIAALWSTEAAIRTRRLALPTVLASFYKTDDAIVTVASDAHQIGKMGAEHLLSLKLPSLGVCCHNKPRTVATALNAGFAEVVQQTEATLLPACTLTNERQIIDWLRDLPRPAGILCDGDGIAMTISRLAQERGIRIPQDLAICGVGNDVFLDAWSRPRLTSIALQPERIGWHAAQAIHRMLDGKPVASLQLPPDRVIARASTDLIFTADPAIAKAVHFIRRHAGHRLPTAEIAGHVGLLRRTLENRFRKAMGCSVQEEVLRCKLARVTTELVRGNASIKTIAGLLGEPNPNNLARFVKQHTGLSPGEYRRRHTPQFSVPTAAG